MEKAAMQSKVAKRESTSLIQIKNYINGELLEPIGKGYIDNYNPATGKCHTRWFDL